MIPCQTWSSVLRSEGHLDIQMIDLTSDHQYETLESTWNSFRDVDQSLVSTIGTVRLLQMFLSDPNTKQDVFFPSTPCLNILRQDVPIV